MLTESDSAVENDLGHRCSDRPLNRHNVRRVLRQNTAVGRSCRCRGTDRSCREEEGDVDLDVELQVNVNVSETTDSGSDSE